MFLPEGTRTTTGRVGEFKPGPFVPAQRAGEDVVPVAQVVAFDIQNVVDGRHPTTAVSGPTHQEASGSC